MSGCAFVCINIGAWMYEYVYPGSCIYLDVCVYMYMYVILLGAVAGGWHRSIELCRID